MLTSISIASQRKPVFPLYIHKIKPRNSISQHTCTFAHVVKTTAGFFLFLPLRFFLERFPILKHQLATVNRSKQRRSASLSKSCAVGRLAALKMSEINSPDPLCLPSALHIDNVLVTCAAQCKENPFAGDRNSFEISKSKLLLPKQDINKLLCRQCACASVTYFHVIGGSGMEVIDPAETKQRN